MPSKQPFCPTDLCLTDLSITVGDQTLLHKTSVEIPSKKITVIVGASGAGKSVLLRVIAGLVPRSGDVIRWDGDVIWGRQTQRAGDDAAPAIGVVFQNDALFDELSPAENVQFAISHQAIPVPQADFSSATQWLERLGVPADTPTSVLSGGQKQRLAIARTLAANPELILYDEPTSGLDSATGDEVAKLITETHQRFGQTSVIVTHDYETLLPIADCVILFDAKEQELRRMDSLSTTSIQQWIAPVIRDVNRKAKPTCFAKILEISRSFFETSGRIAAAAVMLPFSLCPWVRQSERDRYAGHSLRLPRASWIGRFFLHYLRLVGGPSAWGYLIIAGLIAGFTTTYFTFRFLPFRGYTQPLMIDELLSSIGFALYRVLVPILATVLIAARCGAAVAADVGVKRYNGTIDAMRTFGVPGRLYLLIPIVIAFLVATPILQWIAFQAARMVAAVTFMSTHDDLPIAFWGQHFDRHLRAADDLLRVGWKWNWLKASLCGLASGVIGYYRGNAPKGSASDISHAITSTVLWSTLSVLLIHFVVALFEF